MDFILDHPRCALFAGMGMGKTLMALTVADARYAAEQISAPTLVIGPKRVARDTWATEAAKWEHLRNVETVYIGGDKNQREAALKKDVAIFTTNYEQLPWLVDRFGEKWPFKSVIADESTKLKGFRLQQGGRRAQALGKIAWNYVDFWLNLTGTPAPNGLIDLWGQTWFLDRGERLGRTFGAFCERWFYRPPRGVGEFSKLQPHKHAEKEIYSKLRDICLTLDPKDWFDIDDPIVTQVKVKLPPPAMKIYKEFEKTMYAELLDQSELEVFNAAALTNKCLQIANGAVYYGNEGYKPVHDAKLEALESIVNESGGMPVLVAYQFVSDKERILKAFPGFVDISTKKGMEAFRSGNAVGGLAHPKSMGHGIDGLQDVTNILVRFGHDWNLEERLQMLERIGPVRQKQSGHDRPCLIYDLVAEGTIDETVIARHETKREVQDLLLAAMKRNHHMLRRAA